MNATRSTVIQMLRLTAVLAILCALDWGQSSRALASPWQVRDVVQWGNKKFGVVQLPLERVIIDSKTPLTLTTFTNNKGYLASWAVRGRQLYLVGFKAQNAEGELSIGDVIEGARLPLKASWFTGKLQLPMGDLDYETQRRQLIVELTFHEGNLKEISTLKDAVEVYTWDGLPYEAPPEIRREEEVEDDRACKKQ